MARARLAWVETGMRRGKSAGWGCGDDGGMKVIVGGTGQGASCFVKTLDYYIV